MLTLIFVKVQNLEKVSFLSLKKVQMVKSTPPRISTTQKKKPPPSKISHPVPLEGNPQPHFNAT